VGDKIKCTLYLGFSVGCLVFGVQALILCNFKGFNLPQGVLTSTSHQSVEVAMPNTFNQSRRPLFSEITVDHGDPGQIGRFFLTAEQLVRDTGITLSFAPMTALLEVNQANSTTWPHLVPALDPTFSTLSDSNAFCILGRNHRGEIVATQAGRLLDLATKSYADICEDLSLFYADRSKAAPEEACRVTSPSARRMHGSVLYSGGAWYRPDVRGSSLSRILPRISRVYGYTRWNTDATLTLMQVSNMGRRINERNGYRHAEWSIDWSAGPLGTQSLAMLWNTRSDTLEDLADFTQRLAAQIEIDIRHRRADQRASAV
jgi:hypothetical protein